ncbi:MAG: SDR family NAD(P)-dependent oxidoreductase [Myxococcota bacterium]
MPESKTALVTGAGGGLGSALVRRLSGASWTVFAADYDDDALASVGELPNVEPLVLDVTDAEAVQRAVGDVTQKTDHLDGVVNFAGVTGFGALIDMPEEKLHRVLDVNLLGTFRVNQAFFPLVLACKGRIVNVSSETGWQSSPPFVGAYALSKHAIEAYTDSLRRELRLLDVSVITIQPGPFKTDMVTRIEAQFSEAERESRYFASVIGRLKRPAVKAAGKAHDPDVLARVVEHALTTKRPKPAYSVKPEAWRVVLHWLPTRVADRVWVAALRGLSKPSAD